MGGDCFRFALKHDWNVHISDIQLNQITLVCVALTLLKTFLKDTAKHKSHERNFNWYNGWADISPVQLSLLPTKYTSALARPCRTVSGLWLMILLCSQPSFTSMKIFTLPCPFFPKHTHVRSVISPRLCPKFPQLLYLIPLIPFAVSDLWALWQQPDV